MTPSKNISGKEFGLLLAISPFDKINSRIRWKCLCKCGKHSIVSVSNLLNGHTKSCGCLKKINDQNKTHGMTRTKTHTAWANMLQRCENPNATQYADYGGRGIKVCKRWKNFKNFYRDMGEAPKYLTLDRINNDRDYKPSNCRWATYFQQANNRRNNKCLMK